MPRIRRLGLRIQAKAAGMPGPAQQARPGRGGCVQMAAMPRGQGGSALPHRPRDL